MRTAGFVLVGGRSSRMGQDKALLSFTPHAPLVSHIAGLVQRVAGSAILLGPPARYGSLGWECWGDLRAGQGPLAGLEAALTRTSAPYNLIVACDLPGIQAATLADLLAQAIRQSAPCTLLRDGAGRVHPLCGVYHPICLSHIQSALDSGDRKVLNVVGHLVPAYFDVPFELANINRPEEWRKFLQALDPAGAPQPVAAESSSLPPPSARSARK
ncbi:MAG: molybdenum cofactor guanylyltransferase [Bryobacteraceae bacterium]